MLRKFFHAATENMAALLRTARLLKLSPSGLLQIAGTKRTGPPLGRLYSGTLCGRTTGICSRQISRVSDNVCSGVWPYSVGCVRNYIVATEQKDEAGTPVQTKQAQQFEYALARLDSSVKRTGRITKTLLLRIFHDICRTGFPSGNQALLLLRSCGSLLPEIVPNERTELAHHIWDTLQEAGAQYDISHYNALLKVYLQNEFKFSPTDFLAKMEAANIQPNRVTYQRLIAAYCNDGDIEGASTILGFMKSKDLPITEAVFSSLVTGHARAGDIKSAENILPVMQGAGMEPGPDTYVSLLNAYAELGDLDNMKKILDGTESANYNLQDRDIMQVIFTLAKAGHQQHIPYMIEHMRQDRRYIPDAMNLCLNLITHGHEDSSFLILKNFLSLLSDGASDSNLGNFFLRHCVNMDTPLEKIARYCKELKELNVHSAPLSFVLSCALGSNKTDTAIELMKLSKEQGLPIRPHFFWPLLIPHVKEKNTAGVLELIKAMLELGVAPDTETLSNYVLCTFPNLEAARQALQDTGISTDIGGFLFSEIRLLALNNLAELYTLLSSPASASVDLVPFRGSLLTGFRRSADVESMVKITKLLYEDERFSKEKTTPAEATGFFLYGLIDSMSESQLRAQEAKLRNFFNQLQAQDVTVSRNVYRGISNLLRAQRVHGLIKDVALLVDPKDRQSDDEVTYTPRTTGSEVKVPELVNRLAELKAQNKPFGSVLKQAIQALSAEENMQHALELKQQYEEGMTAGSYAILISLCCRHNNVEEALNLKREMSRKDSSTALDATKYITLVRAFSVNDRVDDAVDILKEMKEKEVVLNDTHVTTLFYALSAVAAKGDVANVRRLQDTIFTLGLTKPTSSLCSPLVSAYLDRGDLPAALEVALECEKRYKQLPRIHDILVALVEKGETELLQKAMDFVSQERGEMIMLYDLFFAFLQTGRYREARQIIQTPGMRAKPGRLHWFAEKCIFLNQMETLEQMVEMTAKLFECDRDEMYSYILRLCKETNDWQKAESAWTKMQEENIIPRERTMCLLADILKNNGQEVPFEVPETWYQQAATTKQVKPEAVINDTDYNVRLLTLCKKGKIKEAYGILKEADKKGVTHSPTTYDHLIRALLAEGSTEDAMIVKEIAGSRVPGFKLSEVANGLLIVTYSKKGQVKDALETLKSMIQVDHVPARLSITRLVQALGDHGDLAGIQEVESIVKSLGSAFNISNMLYINNKALAHIKNGDLEAAVELLEGVYTSPESSNPSMSFVFRKILEADNDHAVDKLSAMAERLANHFACYRPATDLFIQLLEMDKVEDAKFMLARCNALAEQKDILLSFVAQKAQTPGQVDKIKNLHSLIPDFTRKEVFYSYLMKCHVLDKDLKAAKALHSQMQKEGIVADELSLKRLAVLYREAGEMAPFPEPPKSFKFYANQLKEKATQMREEE